MTDAARGEQLIEWIGGLEVHQGEHAGSRMREVIQPFQRRFLRGLARHPEAALTMGRGNGKTMLAAAIAAACIAGPLAVPHGEVILVCPTYALAERNFAHILAFLRRRIDRDRRRWSLTQTTNVARLVDRQAGTRLSALSSAPTSLHGYAPSLVIADEPAQWRPTRADAMIAALRTALGKQPWSRLIAIGTRSPDPDHWHSRMLYAGGSGVYAQIHAADPDESPYLLRQIRRANPMIDVITSLRVELLRARDNARLHGGEELAQWLSLRLNLGVTGTTSRDPIVAPDDWLACVAAVPPPPQGPVAVGMDLGGSTSMTALVAYWPETGRLEARGAFPAVPPLRERAARDGAGRLYELMVRRGEIELYPGRVTPVGPFLRAQARRLQGHEVALAVADRYRQAEAEQALAAAGVAWPVEWRAVGSGQHGSADLRAFQAAVYDSHLASAPSLLMESAIAESQVEYDRRGNVSLGRARQRGRIDALQAAVLAVGAGDRLGADPGGIMLTPADYVLPL